MSDVKNCFKWLLFYYLLLAGSTLLDGIFPDQFPTENICSLYLIFLSVCLIQRYRLRITGQPKQRAAMLAPSYMVFMLLFLRCIKYSVFGNKFVLGRYTWYLYYVPLLMIPTLLFYVALYIYAKDEKQINRKWGWVVIVSSISILLVLTNDLHQQVFRFKPDFANWDGDYSYGWIFYVITVWEYMLYLVAIVVLIVKSSIAKIKYHVWPILIPFILGIVNFTLLVTDKMPRIDGNHIMEFPEALCFMVVGILECCMQLGMIPTNDNYRGIMELTTVPVQITDFAGNSIYRSDVAKELTEEQFSASGNTRIGEHIILQRIDIPGGFGFWQNDVTEIDRLNEELEETKERLREEAELIRLQNELKEKQKTIEQRNALYDAIAKKTRKQSLSISRIAKEAMTTPDTEQKDRYRKQIVLLGAYIKRYANLMIMSSENETINVGELGLSVAELLRYLNLYGISGEYMNTAVGEISSDKALVIFEAMENFVEKYIEKLKGVYVILSMQDNQPIVKVTLENISADSVESFEVLLGRAGVQMLCEYEDEVGYFSFVPAEGGDEV